MDDVGRDDDTLTLLSVIRPDVVKVDMSILHGEFDSHASRVSSTVRSYCDRTGAWMLCEGIETAAHEMRARALGADLVQGFRYAHPDSLPELIAPVLRPIELRGIGVDEPQPFRDVIAQIPTAHLPGDRVQQMASELVAIASSHTDAAVVLLSAPSANDVPTTYLDALAELAEKACVVALIAPGSEPNPRPGVTGVDADATSDLGCPWSVTAIAPAMAATILTDPFGGDPTDPVEHRVIHDRSTVAHAARVLLALVSSTAAP